MPITAFLHHQVGITQEPHRLGLLQVRLRSRLQARGYQSFRQFAEQSLLVDPSGWGAQLVLDLSTINHTSFFREPAHFPFLCERVLQWWKEFPSAAIRIWSAGCSSGQEPYSIAIALAEALTPQVLSKVEIWASDLSLEMLKAATRAIYTTREVQGVSPVRLRRYFLRGMGPREGSFRVVPEIRDLVKFRHLDLRSNAWALPCDFQVIFCRNVSIYFSEEERLVLLDRLARYLHPSGWLVMGNGEIFPTLPASLRRHAPSLYQREG
jgi:chemotaxis protein methyltransferase CheR